MWSRYLGKDLRILLFCSVNRWSLCAGLATRRLDAQIFGFVRVDCDHIDQMLEIKRTREKFETTLVVNA